MASNHEEYLPKAITYIIYSGAIGAFVTASIWELWMLKLLWSNYLLLIHIDIDNVFQIVPYILTAFMSSCSAAWGMYKVISELIRQAARKVRNFSARSAVLADYAERLKKRYTAQY